MATAPVSTNTVEEMKTAIIRHESRVALLLAEDNQDSLAIDAHLSRVQQLRLLVNLLSN